jgi:flagellar basal body-associated protein FliL
LGMLALIFLSFKKEASHQSIEDIAAHPPGAEGGGGHGDKKAEGHGGGGEHGGGHGGGHGEGGEKKKSLEFGKMVTLEQFTVNLSTPGSVNPKFVRANLSLEVPSEDVETEVTSKMPQVRNTVIDLFNSKRPVDLATVDGREYLKEEIKNAVNIFLVKGKVKGVYFTNFALAGS